MAPSTSSLSRNYWASMSWNAFPSSPVSSRRSCSSRSRLEFRNTVLGVSPVDAKGVAGAVHGAQAREQDPGCVRAACADVESGVELSAPFAGEEDGVVVDIMAVAGVDVARGEDDGVIEQVAVAFG